MKHSPYKRSAQDSKALTGLFQGQDVAGREHKPWRTPSPRSSPPHGGADPSPEGCIPGGALQGDLRW